VDELLTVASVARQLGVAPSTLRTWDRRYGLGPTLHIAGEHRRYCPEDLGRLNLMRRLISAGVAPIDAAEQAKAHRGKVVIENIIDNCSNCSEMIGTLYRATNTLDRDLVETLIRKEIADHGIIAAWQDLIVPVLVMVGADWEATGTGVEVEHMLTEILKRVMREDITQIASPINSRPVLLASVGEELHSLALHALAAALAERSIETYFLGARTPLEALCGMVTRSAPPAIFLWAQLPQNGDPKFFREIPAIRPAPRIILGGPGWDRELCADAAFVDGLASACEEITRAVGA
jgi:DNA-binding transcriptional MerR regulator